MVKKYILLLIFILVLFFAVFKTQILQVTTVLSGLLNPQIQLKQENNTINVLVLGIGGGNHDGPNLSDTIIFASIHPDKNEVDLISLPRDLWIPDLQDKINSAYADGQAKNNSGILFADAAIQNVMGAPIDYTMVVDFDGYVKTIDLMGGVNVQVVRSFDDYQYPIDGRENDTCGLTAEQIQQSASSSAAENITFPCRYEHIHFNAGQQHMDGATALEFVRSRHATGAEGSDFARSARQHLVIEAVKSKVFSLGTLLNPVKLVQIYSTLQQNIHTDIPTNSFDDFIKLAEKMKNAKIVNYVIDEGDSSQKRLGLLINPPISNNYYGAWVLIPRVGNGNFSEIHDYLACIENYSDCVVTPTGVASAASLSPTSTTNKLR